MLSYSRTLNVRKMVLRIKAAIILSYSRDFIYLVLISNFIKAYKLFWCARCIFMSYLSYRSAEKRSIVHIAQSELHLLKFNKQNLIDWLYAPLANDNEN